MPRCLLVVGIGCGLRVRVPLTAEPWWSRNPNVVWSESGPICFRRTWCPAGTAPQLLATSPRAQPFLRWDVWQRVVQYAGRPLRLDLLAQIQWGSQEPMCHMMHRQSTRLDRGAQFPDNFDISGLVLSSALE